MVTELPSVVLVTVLPPFPARSLNSISIAASPSGPVVPTVIAAVHTSPTHVTGEATRPAIVTVVLLSSGSDAVKFTVITLPTPAGDGSDEIATGDSVGTVVSIVTELESVDDVTFVPTFPARSAKPISNAATPSGSDDSTTMLAVHTRLMHVTGDASRPAIVAVIASVFSGSDAVKVTVIVLLALAGDVVDATVTGDNVGAVLSIVTELASVVVLDAV